MVVGVRLEDLGRHVLVRSAEGGSRVLFGLPRAPSEVAQFRVEVLIQKNVFGLEVSVDDVVVVDVLHRGGDLQVQVD